MSSRTLTALTLVILLIGMGLYWWIRPAGDTHVRKSLDEQIALAGFTPLHPPTLLSPPGSLVMVLSRDPLNLGLVCSNTACLGSSIADFIQDSKSADSSTQVQFEGAFSVEGNALRSFTGAAKLEEVRNVSVRLSNVTIHELADDDIIGGVEARTLLCTAAMQLRRNAGAELVLIKAVLQADAMCTVQFSSDLTVAAKQAALNALAGSLGMRASTSGQHTLSGEHLIWGVRDDALLAWLPDIDEVNPSIGSSESEPERRTLPVNRPATLRELPNPFSSVIHLPVEPLRQPDSMSCWATVAAMMVNWRDERDLTAEELVASIGEPWQLPFELESGLTLADQEAFANAIGLVTEAPQNYTLAGYESLLREYGPVWFTSGDLFSSHARLLIGLARSADPDAGSFFQVIDPANGSVELLDTDDFIEQFERQARNLRDIKPDQELPRQVLHWP